MLLALALLELRRRLLLPERQRVRRPAERAFRGDMPERRVLPVAARRERAHEGAPVNDLLRASRVVATLAALVASCATWRETGSLYRRPCPHEPRFAIAHAGARPAGDNGGDLGATVQLAYCGAP